MKIAFKFLLSSFAMLTLISCESQPAPQVSYTQFVEVLANADGSVNELSANSGNEDLNAQLNSVFQSISKNTNLVSKAAQDRVREKIELLKQCSQSMDHCNYVPEGFSIETNKHLLNVKYQYNQFSSYDTYYTYAVIDLRTAKRMTWADVFANPDAVLKKYEAKYIQEYESYLSKFDLDNLREDEEWEYEVIREHLDNRASFELDDLNNLEFIFDANEGLQDIRFHFGGSGGNYRSILTDGYISFEPQELEPYMVKDF